MTIFYYLGSEILISEGPGHRIYIHQGQLGPVTFHGTGFPFLRFLWLAGLRCCSNPPLHGQRLTQAGTNSGCLKAKTTFRLSLKVKSHLGNNTRFLLLSDCCMFADVGRSLGRVGVTRLSVSHDQIFITVRQLLVCLCPLVREDESVVYNCC